MAKKDGPTVVAVINMKGGVGKSTIATLLCHRASAGHRLDVLAVDLDPQANMSQAFMGANYDRFLREKEPSIGGVIGLFPVLSETPDRLIAGFDDHHLDFRVIVDVGEEVTATTVVKTHNLFGRLYLAVVLPFHRVIVRHLLRRAFG